MLEKFDDLFIEINIYEAKSCYVAFLKSISMRSHIWATPLSQELAFSLSLSNFVLAKIVFTSPISTLEYLTTFFNQHNIDPTLCVRER